MMVDVLGLKIALTHLRNELCPALKISLEECKLKQSKTKAENN